ncbi:hypothetical protein ACM760_05085 [Pseudomonas aeruginosa]|uniref:Uncharacterized protein n=2 Tax=Gammaproteobacteria TaxID=1236 RepID=B3G1S5_PSEAI|nr:hypothetical protein [Pseudomonas aeruginosa]ACD38987.1 hypothetical protein PACL_0199 [Pseudomonas aeruginosa]MCC0264783.1 hypothetical protein [Pseudomonas aeruginosa]MCS7722356.1 hypothetical protein [Pseudomonas aeruginosa]MCS9531002.1 hypothetical protein [Pseudomonas aeruginosa]MCS9587001.1 hypothetical protein [Pseudomonas aeruginosa]
MSKREILLNLASEQGQSPRVIGEILNLLGAHPELIDLPRAIDQLLRVLRACSVGLPIGLDSADDVVLHEACRWLISLSRQPNIRVLLGEQFWMGNKMSARNPVSQRGVKIFGFPYASFLHILRDYENGQDYERLLAQVLVATQKTPTDRHVDQRYRVYLEISKLCGLRFFTIPPELKIWGTTEEFVASCRVFLPSKSSSGNAKSFAAIARLVRYCNGDSPRTGGGGGGYRGKRKQDDQPDLIHYITEDPRGFVLGDPDDPDQLPGHYDILGGHTDTVEGDLAPGEMSPSTEIWVLDDDGFERPYVADLLGQQNVEAHIVRSRQFLPFSYNQLTLKELRNLLFGASDLFHSCLQELSCPKDLARIQLRMEGIVALHISLWLGQSMTQVVQLSIVDDETDDADGLALILGDSVQFSMVVRRPDLAGDDRWQASSGVRVSLLRILLPDLAGSARLVKQLLKAFPRSANQVFTYQTEQLDAEIKALLLELGEDDRRYTRTKLRSYLFHQIVADTQDVAAASMLSGVEIPSAQTPRYYLQLDACHLRKIYTTSLVRVLTQVYACAGLAYEHVNLNADQQGGLGATHCLLPTTIESNVSAMARVLRRKTSGRLSEMVAWHNCFTLWTVQMFMLVTSCRAVRNPLMLIGEFDSVLGMGALSDKDSGDRHMSRLICMPPMLRRQITSYFAHCASISRQFIGYLPQDEEDHQWSRGFFLQIGQAGVRRAEITPGNIYDQMGLVSGYTTHRVNAHRKFIRTELTERGCPSEALAAFMGHWLRGEEPQDAYSTFCPAVYAKVLDEWITPLLRELGWSALSSQWVTE